MLKKIRAPLSLEPRSSSHSFMSLVLSLDGGTDPKEIIDKLRVLPNLRYLNLNYNPLGGEGSKVLFRWLAYGDGDGDDDDVSEENNGCLSRPPGLLQLTNISLSGARLGDVGFGALVGWLERLKKWHQMDMNISSSSSSPDGIRGLHLQNNYINGTSELALSFVSAFLFHKTEPYIFSSLSYLNLSTNPLSSEFKQVLFCSLPSLTSLRNLLLNMTGLNNTDADAIAAYIGQCRLTNFNASSNKIGYRGIKNILKAMKRCWTLERVDMYANDIGDMSDDNEESSGESDDDDEENPRDLKKGRLEGGVWRRHHFASRLQRILSRNLYLKRTVQAQAFELLRSSRLLLLNRRSANDSSHSELDLLVELVAKEEPHHSSCSIHQHNCDCLPTFHRSYSKASSPVSINDPETSNSHFPFTRLPIEIQLLVLSELAPILSSSQQVRIFEHAIDKTTLPDLSLHLPSSNSGGGVETIRTVCGGIPGADIFGPKSTQGSGAMSKTRRDQERQRWLDLVKCDAYDPNL